MDLQNETYDDSVRKEVRMSKQSPLLATDPTTSVWGIDKITETLNLVMSSVDKMKSLVDLVSLSVSLGRMSRSLDLTGSAETDRTLRHLIGTLLVARDVTIDGGTVHAIEGCDSNYRQIMGDLDLLYTSDKTYAVDYTQHGTPEHGYVVLTKPLSGMVRTKYNKLVDMYPQWTPQVVTHGNSPVVKLELNYSTHKSPREDDFSAADNLSTLLKQLTLDQAEESIEAYTSCYERFASDHRGMVETPRNAPLTGVGRMVSENSPQAAALYEEFRTKLSEEAQDRYYSGSHYSAWEDEVVKADFKLPLYKQGCSERNPFARVHAIVKHMQIMQKPVSSFVLALSKLSQQDEADFLTPNGIGVIKRVEKDGEKFNAVELHFPDNWSLSAMRAEQKRHIPSLNYHGGLAQLEEEFCKMDEDMMSDGPGGEELDNIEKCIRGTMLDTQLGEQVRAIMLGQFETIARTKIGSWMSQKQEIAKALLSVPRKRQSLSCKMGGFFDQRVLMSVDCVGTRYAVTLTGMGPTSFSSSSVWNYMVVGSSVDMRGSLTAHGGLSRVLSATQATLDWDCTSLAKSLSYYSHITEMRMAVLGKRVDLSHERSMPMMIMQQNNNKFAQASEMVRYLFVNGTGWSSSPKSLFEKIAWFKPTTFTQKLYILRMCKMSDGLQAFKSHDILSQLRLKNIGLVATKEGGFVERRSEYWNIAMPNELTPSKSDHAVFNSFYVCRAMTIQRYNKLVSEALVLEKQLDSREEYLHVKSQNLEHELRFCPNPQTADDLAELLTMPLSVSYGPWSTSWVSQVTSILATALRLRSSQDVTVGDVFNRLHNLGGVLRTLKISDVMNSRGSVLTNSDTGITVLKREKLDEKRVKTITQNSKCWTTLLLALQDVVRGVKPPKADYYAVATQATKDVTLQVEEIQHHNDSLWPLVLWASEHHAACVSKMVHKDQIGAREIAVLNAWSRVMCYYVECLARTIRDDEHRSGLTTNLIERRDKEEIVEAMLLSGQANRRQGSKVLFDSADCSKWGPSMMPANLYLTIAARMPDGAHKHVLRNCLSLFGTKLFKIPDHYFDVMNERETGAEKVGVVFKRLLDMPVEMGSYGDQYLRLEESMHQGILGVSSSVFGSDAHNLSNMVLERMFKADNLKCKTHITSDDYSRTLMWTSEKGVYALAKESLAVHNEILLSCGIKRNLQKSALSAHYMEFNSVFHTYSGSFRPDVKQRLSYVDYGHSMDPEPNAKRAAEMASEYLRNDGGLIGACWIAALNNSLLLTQNQLHQLYSQIGLQIYSVPLELGGLVMPHPLRSLVGTGMLTIHKNYGDTVKEAFDQLMSHNPDNVHEMSAYLDDETLKVSSFSRSGVVRLSTRTKRASRALREFMVSQPLQFFEGVLQNRERNDLVKSLLACAHREMSVETTMGSAMRLSNCMHVHNQKIFKFNCSAYNNSDKVSRSDLDDLAISFAAGNLPEVAKRQTPIDLARLQAISDSLDLFCSTAQITDFTWMPRKMHKEKMRIDIAPSFYIESQLAEFENHWNPLHNENVTPWDYLESKEVFLARLTKLTRRSQNLLLALMEGDQLGTTLHHRILLSNYCGGCRARVVGVDQRLQKMNVDQLLKDALVAISNPNYNGAGKVVQFTSNRYPAMMRKGLVSKTDITGALNILSNDGEYEFSDDTLRVQLINTLVSAMKAHPHNFTVYPRRLSSNFQAVEHSTTSKFHVHQRAVRNRDNDVVGREFIMKTKDSWMHRVFVTEDDVVFPKDNKTDMYEVETLVEPGYLDVVIKDYLGCTTVSFLSGQPVQVLSVGVLEETEILMIMDDAIEQDLDYLRSLGVCDARESDLVEFRDIFLQSTKAYAPINEDIPDDSDKEDEDEELYSDDDMYEAGMASMMDVLSLLDTTDPLPSEFENVLQMADMSEVIDEDEDEVDVSEIRPMSESHGSRALSFLTRVSNSAAMRDVTRFFVKKFKLNKRQKVYSIKLPYKLPMKGFKDDGRGRSLSKLLQEVNNLPDVEANFLKSYILESVATFPTVVSAFIMHEAESASADVGVEGFDDSDFA